MSNLGRSGGGGTIALRHFDHLEQEGGMGKRERREGDDEYGFRASRLGGMKKQGRRTRRERRELKRKDKGEERQRRWNDVEDRSLEAWTAAIRGSEGMRRARGRRERSCDERLQLPGSELRSGRSWTSEARFRT